MRAFRSIAVLAAYYAAAGAAHAEQAPPAGYSETVVRAVMDACPEHLAGKLDFTKPAELLPFGLTVPPPEGQNFNAVAIFERGAILIKEQPDNHACIVMLAGAGAGDQRSVILGALKSKNAIIADGTPAPGAKEVSYRVSDPRYQRPLNYLITDNSDKGSVKVSISFESSH